MYAPFVDRYGRRISLVNYIANESEFVNAYHLKYFKVTNLHPEYEHLLGMIGKAFFLEM